MYVVVAVVVIAVVVVSVGAYVLLGLGGGGGGEEPLTVADATSLRFSTDGAFGGGTATYRFSGKNLGTDDLMVRVDIESNGNDLVCILHVGEQKAWANTSGTFMEDNYAQDWADWGNQWTSYVARLQDWSEGDGNVTYTVQGNSVTIYAIAINPTLEDSFFEVD
jgi:FlaG/FlaF family flagellin (archaellin)